MSGEAGGLTASVLTLNRGDLTICREIDLAVPHGEITVVLGANGAGKSTLLDGLAGVVPVTTGAIHLDGVNLTKLPPHRRTARGLAYVEQGRTVFSRLTVRQNLAVVDRSGAALERAFALFPRLAQRHDTRAGLLSGGEQQMLVIARALATRPSTLLVDELSQGLAPHVVRTLMEALAALAAEGVGVLLVEQFAQLALQVGTTAHVLQQGRIVHSAPCAELLADRDGLLTQHYLGAAG